MCVSKVCIAHTSSKNDHILLLCPVQVIVVNAPQNRLISLAAREKGTLCLPEKGRMGESTLPFGEGSSHTRSSLTVLISSPGLVTPAPFLVHRGRSPPLKLVLDLL